MSCAQTAKDVEGVYVYMMANSKESLLSLYLIANSRECVVLYMYFNYYNPDMYLMARSL